MPVRYKDLGDFFPMYQDGANHLGLEYWKRFLANVQINDGAGAATTDTVGAIVVPHHSIVVAAYVASLDGDIVPNAVNYAGFEVWLRTAGVARVAAAAGRTTAVVGLTQYIPAALTISVLPVNLLAFRGDEVEVRLTKANAGVAVNEILVSVHLIALGYR